MILEADLTLIGQRFQRGIRVEIAGDGRIERVGGAGDGPGPPDRRLAGRALVPGMVNAHSHGFQRGLRGRGERFPDGGGSFWSWREAMYGLVAGLDAERASVLWRRAFGEMLAAGLTTVGEFHYLHHAGPDGGFALDEVLIGAAAEVGIRLVLLNAYYRTGGIAGALEGAARRFAVDTPEAYWRQMERLAAGLDPATQSLGAAAHSIRAAGIDEIAQLHGEAARRGLVFHMHVEEQPREIADCRRHYGLAPMALLNERGIVDERFVAVHCTHTAPGDLAAFGAAGGTVCLCPLTEANLGDGLAAVPAMLRGGGVCLGTDSNLRLCMLEEMRWLEYGQRLGGRMRGACVDAAGRCGAVLFEAATAGGARALGVPAGVIAPGTLADLVAVDLEHPSLAGWTEETLLDGLVFGCGNPVIAGTCVGGRWVYERGGG